MLTDVKRYRLRSMPRAHCLVEIHTAGGMVTDIVLESYRTDVIILDLEFREITCTGTYSKSTRKQIGRFMNEFTVSEDYSSMKELAGTPMQYKFLKISDSDYAHKIAKSYLENDTPLSYDAYKKYQDWCKEATANSYYW